MVKIYELEIMDSKPPKDWTCDKKKNPYLTETAGFIPLEAQIQRFEQAGIRAKFTSDMFDSSDYNDMYLNPLLRITDEDDEIDVEEKLEMRNFIRNKILQSKLDGEKKKTVEVMADEYERFKRSEAERRAKDEKANNPTAPAVGAES